MTSHLLKVRFSGELKLIEEFLDKFGKTVDTFLSKSRLELTAKTSTKGCPKGKAH